MVLQDYFCLGRSVYCLTAIFKDISEKALVIIPSHKHRFNQSIHVQLITFITVSLDPWPCRFLGDWLSIEHMMWHSERNYLIFCFLVQQCFLSFYQKKPSICTNRTIRSSSHPNSSTSVHIWGKYFALASIGPEIFIVSNLCSLWQIWDTCWEEFMHRRQYWIAGQVILQSAQEFSVCPHCQSSVLAMKC